MARIRSFREGGFSNKQGFRVDVDCEYSTIDVNGARYLQLDTFGADDRATPGKANQTLHIDFDHAQELVGIIRRCFPGMGARRG